MKNIQFLQLAHQLVTDTNITANEFRIYTYLLTLYNDEKKCSYPSLETISNKLNISLTTVKKSIKRLVELGYMKIEKKKTDRGFYNTYTSFKNMIKRKFNKKSNEEKESKEDIVANKPVDSNGAVPIEGQIHLSDIITEENQDIENIKSITGLKENEVNQLLKMTSQNRILEVYEYSKNKAKNLYSFMFKAIKDNWSIQSVVSPALHGHIETGRGNYTSNNSKRFKRQLTEEEIRRAEELENDLLSWYQ